MPRALRITAWSVGSVLGVIGALVAAVLVAGNTDGGRRLLERALIHFSDGEVRVAGLSGSFPAAIDVRQLQLGDEHGTWLSAEGISLRWSPLALLARHLKVERLHFARLAIERRPVSKSTRKSETETQLPHIDIHDASIDTLELGPELAGVRASLTVRGEAHVRSLADADLNLTAHRTDAPGDYQITLRSDAAHMDASLALTEHAGGALANLLRVPALGELSVKAQLSGPRNAGRLHLTASAGQLTALAQGSVDLTGAAADLDFNLQAAAMTPAEGLSWQHIALNGHWQGAVNAPHAEAQLRIDGLQVHGDSGLKTLSANLNADGGELAVHAVADGLVVPGPQPKLLSDAPLRLDARVRLNEASRPVELKADHRLFSLQAQAVSGTPARAHFTVRLPDLAPLAAVANEKLRGRAELTGAVEEDSAKTHLNLEASTELANGPTLVSSLLAGTSHLQLAATLTDGRIELERLSVKGPTLSASAAGTAQRGAADAQQALESLRAHFEASLANLGAVSPALAGTLSVNGSLDGPMTSLASELHLTSALSVRGSSRGTIEASLKARGLPSLTSATIQAQGQLAGAPLELDAALDRLAGDAFHLRVARGEWKSAHIEGDLTTGADVTHGHGGLHLAMAHLEDLQPLLGTSLKGSLSGSLALRPEGRRTYTQLSLEARDVVAAGIPAEVHLTGSGTLEATDLQLRLQSANVEGAPADLESRAHLDLRTHELRLDQLVAHYHAQAVSLLSPAQLSFAEGLAVRGVKLGLQKAVIELDGQISPLDLHAAAHHIDASVIKAFVPNLLAQGSFDLEAKLAGTSSAPSGLVTLNGTQLRLSSAQDLHPIDLHASARLVGQSAQLDVHLDGGRDSQLALTGTAPLDAAGALNLKVNGKLDAGFANPMLAARGERLTGALTVDATVKGALRSPEVQGTFDLAHGDARDYVEGVHLSSITAHLTANGGTLRIESLTAHAGAGQLSLTGQLALMERKLPLSVRVTAKNAQPVESDILKANLDADIKVEGTLRERLDVTGTIQVNRAEIGIPNALPPQVAVLDVRRPGEAPPPPPERQLVIGLDLTLHAPREIRVQGRGLNAELGGNLHITGTTANLVISGGFNMIRGNFALASTRLEFTRGRVSFTGTGLAGKLDPTLDFTAQASVADSTVTLHITGLADSPQFELSSTPALPQDEILARLLFGESASQLSALQIAQIGAALASLSGVGGSGPNPLARVQKSLGLDVLSVQSGNSGSTQGNQNSGTVLEAGRYVSNRVFVAGRQSTTGFSQVEVDVDLSKHLKLQTRLGNGSSTTQGITPENDPGSSVGMVYQFQY
jgi:translocation and assembly module TamB